MKYEPLEAEAYYHLYNRGNNSEDIFKEQENYSYFLDLMGKHLLPIVDLYSYCLLPNHFHFVLKIKDPTLLPVAFTNGKKKLSQPFSNLFNAYAKAINKKYGRTGSLFQDRLKRIRITDERYLKDLILYVNTNATHHGFGSYRKYAHSSYNALVSSGKTALERNAVHELFGGKENLQHCLKVKSENIILSKELRLEE